MENLRSLRKKRGFTCESLGRIVGVGKSTMAKYERGDIQPSQEVLKKMIETLDTTADYLLGLTNDEKSKEKQPLSDEKAAEILQVAFIKSKLADKDGNLSDHGAQVISDFIVTNANILKKLINENS